MNESTSNAIAGAAITSPWWLPILQTWSEVAGLLLPIAGVAWLIIQIITHLVKHTKEKNNE